MSGDDSGSLDYGSQLLNIQQPNLSLDKLRNDDEKESLSILVASPALSSQRLSDGQLNRSLRFSGLPPSQPSILLAKDEKQPLTLSDIILSPSHVCSLSNLTLMDEDSSILNSIFAKITGVQGRSHASSDASA